MNIDNEILLRNKINNFIKRKSFVKFLSGVNSIRINKILTIDVYYLNRKNSLRSLQEAVRNKTNNYETKNYIEMFNKSINVKYFFWKVDKVIWSTKQYQLAQYYYKIKLKKKYFSIVKKYSHANMIYKNEVRNIYSDHLIRSIFKYLIRFYYNKDLRLLKKKFILNRNYIIFKKLLNFHKKNFSLNFIKKQILSKNLAKYTFNILKTNKVKLKYLKEYNMSTIKRFLLFKFKNKVYNYKKQHYRLLEYMKELIKNKIKLLLRKVQKKLHYKKSLLNNFDHFKTKIIKVIRSNNLKILSDYYAEKLESEYNNEKRLYEIIFFKKLYIINKLKNRIKNNSKTFLNLIIPHIQRNIYFNFRNTIKSIYSYKMKLKNTELIYNHNIKKKLLSYIKNSSIINKYIKKNKIKALVLYKNKSLEKLFQILQKFYKYKQTKKQDYDRILSLRNSAIERNGIEKILNECTKQIKQNEEIKTNLYIKKSTQGIKMALKWYNILKNRVLIKRTNKSSSIIPSMNETKVIKYKTDVDEILTIRKKQRERPKYFNF